MKQLRKSLFLTLFVLSSVTDLEHKISSSNYHSNFNLKIEYPPSYVQEVWHCCKTWFELINRETEHFYWNNLFQAMEFIIMSTYLTEKNGTFFHFSKFIYKCAYLVKLCRASLSFSLLPSWLKNIQIQIIFI